MNKFICTTDEAKQALAAAPGQKFVQLLNNGSMQVEYYPPQKVDAQTPHRQDELYVIASGHADFYRDGTTVFCKTGDVLFVPAGMEHRFINFSNDFSTWVIFYGPDGGEKSGS